MFLKNFKFDQNDFTASNLTLQEAIDIMYENHLHHLVILNDKKIPTGIITQSDILKLFKENVNFNEQIFDFALKNLVTLHSSRMVNHALSMMIDNNIKRVIVVNGKEEYIGCIEQERIVYELEDQLNRTNINIHQLLQPDNKAIIFDENDLLKDVLYIMVESKLTTILVAHEGVPYGVISESDIVRFAQQKVDQTEAIKHYAKSPLIQVDTNHSLSDIIAIMRENTIRRIVIYDDQFQTYHILNTKDLISGLKGNYTTFLESKLYDARDTFNALQEYVIEILDLEDEQVIFWTNGITKANFNVHIDDPITKVIPTDIWDEILQELKLNMVLHKTIVINKRYYQIKGHYGTMLEDNVIKIFLNDITEITELNIELQKQNKVQEELLFNQAKMAQMGEMIGNIAHQWRQPLSTISVASSGMQVKKEFDELSDDEFSNLTDMITHNAQYLSNTIEVFRNFLREKKEIKKLCLQDRLDMALNIVGTSLNSKHIELKNSIEYTPPIFIDMVTGELDQVIINILNNAKDVLIERKIVHPWIEFSMKSTKEKIIISIEDNGGGIEEDILNDIFNQYFTTKHGDTGTGLGLYMSHQIIVNSLKGQIYANNSSHGAVFFIELPITPHKST